MRTTLSFLLLVLVLAAPAAAQDKVGTTAATFLGIGQGARPMAMGGAQVAIAEGPTALYWNPSGIVQTNAHAASFTNAQWFVGTDFQQVGLVLNLQRNGHLGLSVTALNYGEMEVTTEARPEGTGERFTPQDLAVGLTYARNLTDRFSVGGTAKYVRQQIWNETANGFALDLGVLYHTGWRGLRIGMSVTNFGTDMKLEGKDLRVAHDPDPDNEGNNPRLPAEMEVSTWPMPLFFRVGVALDAFRTSDQHLLLSLDAQHPNDNAASVNTGLEYGFRDLFFVRGGYRQAFAAFADDSGWTLGAGLHYRFTERVAGRIDYVYYQDNRLGRPQMWTLTVSF